MRCQRAALPILMLLAGAAWASPLLVDDFESLAPNWRQNVKGEGSVTLDPAGFKGQCLRIEAREKALVYYSTTLPIEQVRGKRLIVRAKVKLDNVVRGDREFAEAKLHGLARLPDKPPRNFATRFRGTADWHDEMLVIEVPEDAISLDIDLGIQNGDGVVWYDNLTIDDGTREQLCVNLKNLTNACRSGAEGGFLGSGEVDLRDFPGGDAKYNGVDFMVPTDLENYGRTCLVLAGAERPDLPTETLAVAPVKGKATKLYLLHTAGWADLANKRPCLWIDVVYEDGQTTTLTVQEGVDVGRIDVPTACPNWQPVWEAKHGDGKLGVGVSEWPLPRPEEPIAHIRFRSPGNGAVSAVLALSLEPVKTKPAK